MRLRFGSKRFAAIAALLGSLSASKGAAFLARPSLGNKAVVVRPSSLVRSSTGVTTRTNLFDIFNEGKKALVKKIAGDYDAAAVRSRMDNLIEGNDVLMFSFTT